LLLESTIDIEELVKCVKNYKNNETIPPVEIIETAKNEDNSAVSIYFDYTNLIRPDQRQQEKKYLLPSKLMINLRVEMKNNGKMLSVEETVAFIHCLRSREDEVFDISPLEVDHNL